MKKIYWVAGLGIILRLFTAVYAYHTDTKAIYKDTLLAGQDIGSAYKRLAEAGNPIYYPPLVYQTIGAYYQIAKPLFSNYFVTWMDDWSTKHTLNHPWIFRDLLAMKLPFLIADFLIVWILFKMVADKHKNILLGLWLLNPLVIWSIYVPGNFDVFPTLLTVLAIYAWQKDKRLFSYLLIGLAGGYKLYPLLLLPALWVIDSSPLTKKTVYFFTGLFGFAITLMPIIKDAWALKFIFASNLSSSLFKAAIDIGSGAQIPLFLTIYFGLLLWMVYSKKQLRIESLFSIILLILLALTRFHQQWIIWVIPFLTLAVVENRLRGEALLVFGLAYFGSIWLTDDKFTNLGILKAVNNAFDTLPPLRFYAEKLGLGESSYSASLAFFLAVSIYLVWELWNTSGKKDFEKNWQHLQKPLMGGLMVTPVLIFLFAHVLLAKFGRYIDVENTGSDASITLTKNTVVKQRLTTKNNNFSAIEINLKNVGLRSRDKINWKLEAEEGLKAQGEINGASLGDDYNTVIYFPIISDSAGREYLLTLTAPEAIGGREMMIPFKSSTESARLTVNNVPMGNLSYTTYFNPGGYWNNLAYSLKNMASKW